AVLLGAHLDAVIRRTQSMGLPPPNPTTRTRVAIGLAWLLDGALLAAAFAAPVVADIFFERIDATFVPAAIGLGLAAIGAMLVARPHHLAKGVTLAVGGAITLSLGIGFASLDLDRVKPIHDA